MVNKKGQDLSIGTLILIVLGIVVLVLLILGFSLGWSNLWEKINIFQGGSSIESVIQSCNIAASSNSQFTYCQDFKKVKINGETAYVSCEYGAIQSSLTTKLDCGSEDYEQDYCNTLNEGKKISKDTKINEITCKPSSASN